MTAPTSDPATSLRLQTRILERIAAGKPLNAILDDLCHLVEELFPQSVCSIMVPRENGSLRVRLAPSVPKKAAACLNGLVPGDLAGSCGTAFHQRRTIIVEDTATDPRWEPLRAIAEELGIRACWSVPILPQRDPPLGTFAISHLIKRPAAPEDIEVLEAAGHLAGIAIQRDLTEAAREENSAVLSAVVNGSTDYICSKDLEGRYLLVNTAVAELFGRPIDEIIGHTDQELLPALVSSSFSRRDREVLEAKRGISYYHDFEINGSTHAVHTHKYPLWDQNNEPSGVIAISRDVTDQRRAEQALRQAQKLESLGVLAGGIAHDFNNLLTGILSNADLLMTESLDEHEATASLCDIRGAAQRAHDLTRQMLIYAGKGRPERESVDIEQLVHEVGDLIGSSVSKNARLHFNFPNGLPTIHVNATQLRQVVMNLITNASESLGERSGHIRITGAVCPGNSARMQSCLVGLPDLGQEYLEIVVEDDGCGIDDDTRSRMFDPFFTTKTTGRGLGLATMLGTIHAHEGLIDVVSTPGSGTTFHIFLPVAPVVGDSSESSCGASPSPLLKNSRSNARILVIDDEEFVLTFIERALQGQVGEVTCANRGAAGLRLVQEDPGRFDVVVLDATMPGMSGAEVFQELRKIRRDLPVVMVSGQHSEDAIAGFESEELAGFLAKPFVRADLTRAIDDALLKVC